MAVSYGYCVIEHGDFCSNDDAAGRRCAALSPSPSPSCGCHYLMDQAAGRSASGMPAARQQQQEEEDEQGEHLGGLAGWFLTEIERRDAKRERVKIFCSFSAHSSSLHCIAHLRSGRSPISIRRRMTARRRRIDRG